MALYTFKCRGCGASQTIQSSIENYPDRPSAHCVTCGSEMVRDYRTDAPQPAAMWPEHLNPTTGTVVRDRRQLQSDMDRGADALYERTGIESRPVVVDRADMESLKAPVDPPST